MRQDKYILKGKKVVPFEHADIGTEEGRKKLLEWAEIAYGEKSNRIVKQEACNNFWVSTVFLALDHSFGGDRPILFETMVFDRFGHDVWMDRCSTWDEAETQHEEALAIVRSGQLRHDYRRGFRDMWDRMKYKWRKVWTSDQKA